MKIPIRHSFIRLILLMEACLLIKGEECWMPMVCDGKPTWKNVTQGHCTKEEEKALEALTEQLDGMEIKLYHLKEAMEESETNSVPPSVAGVEETTTLQGYKDRKTSSARTSTVPATTPWSTKEAFLSTVRPQTTKVEQNTECGVVFNSKCFQAIVYDATNVSLSVAESLCKNKLANIYNVTHYNLLRDYLRSMIPDGLSLIDVRSGMTYKNGQLYSTTGQAMSLPNEVWLPNYPFSDQLYTTIVVRVNQNPDSEDQRIRNNHPFNLFHGAICENEL
ncbi:uncharacterized protein LOC120328452 [Styela clava]